MQIFYAKPATVVHALSALSRAQYHAVSRYRSYSRADFVGMQSNARRLLEGTLNDIYHKDIDSIRARIIHTHAIHNKGELIYDN